MKTQKRIKLNHGYATVSEDYSQETIDELNKLADLAYDMNVMELQITNAKITIENKTHWRKGRDGRKKGGNIYSTNDDIL